MKTLQAAAFILLMMGCTNTDPTDEGEETGETGRFACEIPLSISPEQIVLNPQTHASLIPSGGTGAYRFLLESEENGSEVHLDTGSFYAGPTPGITETVVLTDEGCDGSASAQIEIVPNLIVEPKTITLSPNTPFNWTVSGGSGEYAVSFFQNESGASAKLNSGISGSATGHDILHIIDQQTNEMVSIRVYIEEAIEFGVIGKQLVLPIGSSISPKTIHGSGVYQLSTSSDIVDTTDGRITAKTPGLAELQLTDQHVPSFSTTIALTVVEASGYDNGEPGGLFSQQNAAVGPGDLNGDGYPDAILGNQELHVDLFNSGGVVVYAGGPDGLEPEPVQILSGDENGQRFGYSLTTADFNSDGQIDLAVGAQLTSGTGLQNGAVYIYPGKEGGFFESQPSQILMGRYSYDQFGTSLAHCDINGDGLTDLITSSTKPL